MTARHPGYVLGNHWLQTAYERICAGEAEADVLADYGVTRTDQPDGGPDEEDGPWAEGWAERSGTPDQQSAREGLDELTRMAQEDGLYDMPTDKT
jgi:hypothetical protein